MASASLRISTLCLALVISAGLESASRADDESAEGLPPLDESTPAMPASPAELPPPPGPAPGTKIPTGDIEAKAYDIKAIRPSRSGRVYLFEKSDSDVPYRGKIVLLREGTTPIMALRVLKRYPNQKLFAAKKLRTYPGHEVLPRNSHFRLFEKVGDVFDVVPPTKDDLNDLQELETLKQMENAPEGLPPPPPEESAAPVEDLEAQKEPAEIPPAAPTPVPDETPPPAPAEEPAPAPPPPIPVESKENYSSEDHDLEVKERDEEEEEGSYYPNQISMDVGVFSNSNIPGPSLKMGGGFRYGRLLAPSWLIEGSVFYYKSSDSDTGVSLTIVPIIGTIQWLTKLNSIFTGYLYAGFIYPYVATQLNASNDLLGTIQTVSPAIGAGLYIQTGPNWYLRANLGIDSITAGVMLRF